jgi:negative regulator of sigma E activity
VSTHWIDRLSEFHDGELPPAEHAACETHLTECADCRQVLHELQSVVSAARADTDRNPATDLWPGILARIGGVGSAALDSAQAREAEPHYRDSENPRLWGRASARPTRTQITFSLPQLALAASLLIAVSAGVSYVAAGRGVTRPAPAPQENPIQAMAEPMMPPSSDVVPANFADEQFDRAVADLERILVEQRDELDPRTIVVIERNLTIIDEAIRQARAALNADPANTFLNSHLADARRRKLELLRRATNIAGD